MNGLMIPDCVTDIQYSTVLAVLYASYVPAQIPSNMVRDQLASFLAFVRNSDHNDRF